MTFSLALQKKIAEIGVETLPGFLLNNNWSRDSVVNGSVGVFHSKRFDLEEIVIPFGVHVKGYRHLLFDAFEKLMRVYEASHEKLLSAVTGAAEDLVRIRIIHEDVKYGTIRLEDGIQLIHGAKEILASSANSMRQKKRLYLGKLSEDVKEYVDHLRLGQTEIGSYIINVYSEIRKSRDPELFDDVWFDRRVTLQTIDSVRALKETVSEYSRSGNTEVLEEAVARGVSANLCKAVVDLSGSKATNNVSIEIRVNNNIELEDITHNVYFPSSIIPSLREAHDYYISKDFQPDVEIEGFVFKLARDEDEEAGVVNVSAVINEKLRKIKVLLSEEHYETAIAAHRDQRSVALKGDLTIEIRRAELVNVSAIRILGESD